MISLCVLSVAPAFQVPLIFSPNHPFLCASLEFSCLPLLQVSSVQVLGWHLGLGTFTLAPSIPHPFLLEITSQCLGHVTCMLHRDPCSQDPESKQSHLPIFSLVFIVPLCLAGLKRWNNPASLWLHWLPFFFVSLLLLCEGFQLVAYGCLLKLVLFHSPHVWRNTQ